MAKTYSIDVSAPANSTAPSGGAAAIRLLKNAIHERENQDHYWEKSGDTMDADDVGYHRKATLLALAAAPTAKSNGGILYTKDGAVSGKPELFYRDEDGTDIQLTSDGAINVSAAFASTDFILTALATKTGWTDVTATYAGKYLRVGATALATGGSATLAGASGSHVLTIAEIPSHFHNYYWGLPGTGSIYGGATWTTNCQGLTTTSSIGGGGGHTHLLTSVACTPLYVDVRMFQKD